MGMRPYSIPAKPEEIISDIEAVAALMQKLDFTLNRIYRAASPEVRAKLDELLTDYDFTVRGRQLRQFAETWQREVDHADGRGVAPAATPARSFGPAQEARL